MVPPVPQAKAAVGQVQMSATQIQPPEVAVQGVALHRAAVASALAAGQ